jgi:hypothetical protein
VKKQTEEFRNDWSGRERQYCVKRENITNISNITKY